MKTQARTAKPYAGGEADMKEVHRFPRPFMINGPEIHFQTLVIPGTDMGFFFFFSNNIQKEKIHLNMLTSSREDLSRTGKWQISTKQGNSVTALPVFW